MLHIQYHSLALIFYTLTVEYLKYGHYRNFLACKQAWNGRGIFLKTVTTLPSLTWCYFDFTYLTFLNMTYILPFSLISFDSMYDNIFVTLIYSFLFCYCLCTTFLFMLISQLFWFPFSLHYSLLFITHCFYFPLQYSPSIQAFFLS